MRLVSGVRINEYKTKMQERVKTLIPVVGQRVIPRVGVFKNLEGTVLSVDKKKLIAIVVFEKASRVVEAPLNVVNLSILSDSSQCNISL
jgi:transcription antitermination factor NusG